MNAIEIGTKLVALCNEGKNHEAMETLYAEDIVSVEAMSMPDMPAEQRGIAAIMAKCKWWADNHEIHSAQAVGPFPQGDRFIVRFTYEVTFKPTGKRNHMDEMALFTVANGKIVREEFFYVT